MGLSFGEIPLVVLDSVERKAFRNFFGKAFLYPAAAGICCSCAYALILFAMQYVTNVSFIQAFRQLSLPLGFLAGVIFLHEENSRTKTTGLILILAGLLVVSFFK